MNNRIANWTTNRLSRVFSPTLLVAAFWLAALLLPAHQISAAGVNQAALDPDNEEHARLVKQLKIVSLDAYPATVRLDGPFAYRQIVVTGRTDLGQQVDLTHLVEVDFDETHLRLSAEKRIQALQDGQSIAIVRFNDQSLEIPVTSSNTNVDFTPSFKLHVQPVLSKLGCNAGTCHGSKDGKNGFKLSLRGYDPIYDYRSLTDDLSARRFNRAAPDQSLFLLKSTGAVPHAGGAIVDPDSDHYAILRTWISQGARYDARPQPTVDSIQVFPQDPIVPLPGMTQHVAVMATYSDGTVRDVSREAFVESGNIEVAEANDRGRLKLLRRGEAAALVRYEGAYTATTMTVMGDRSGFAWTQPEVFNYIDEHVYRKLKRVKVAPADLCTDDEFVRRVYLDLTGLPPSADQVRSFVGDARDTKVKRNALVDTLIASPEFVEFWTNKWADLLQVNRKFLGEQGAVRLRNWIRQSVSTKQPYDQFVADIITASGSNIDVPPAAYYKRLRTPDELMENTTHLFLAIRFNCNKCHDHPFERWTQDQYYNLAAYFAQVDRKRDVNFGNQNIGGSAVEGATPLVEVIYDKNSGEMTHERTGEIAPPVFPYRHEQMPQPELPRREQLARWLTAAENPYFARSLVNRMWGYMFGIGIIDPIDDIRAGNPPSNPELLDALEQDFIENNFDWQHVLATICKSRTYQHSIRTNAWNEDDTINFSHFIPRRLPAETLYDTIHTALGAPLNIAGVPRGTRAAELPDAGVRVPFLEDFGKPVRESSCECERSSGVVLGPIMKLINGPTIATALTHPESELNQLIENETDDRAVIEELFVRLLARRPTEAEIEASLQAISDVGSEHHLDVQSLFDYEQELDSKQAAWEQSAAKETQWTLVAPVEMSSVANAEFKLNDDQSISVSGPLAKDEYRIAWESDMVHPTALRIEAMPDDSLSAKGPGRAENGNFVVSEIQLFEIRPEQAAANPTATESAERIAQELTRAEAAFSQNGWPVANAIDGKDDSGWAIMPRFGKTHTALFGIQANQSADVATDTGTRRFELVIRHQFPDGKHNLGRFRIAWTDSPQPSLSSKLPADVRGILAIAPAQRTQPQLAKVQEFFRSQDSKYRELLAAVQRGESEIANRRKVGIQDVAWALINNPSFLFNR